MPGNPILLCAPQSDLRDRLERELIASGYPVSSDDSPAEAVAALRDARFDLEPTRQFLQSLGPREVRDVEP